MGTGRSEGSFIVVYDELMNMCGGAGNGPDRELIRARLLDQIADAREREAKIVHVGGLRAMLSVRGQANIDSWSAFKRWCSRVEAAGRQDMLVGWLKNGEKTCMLCGMPVPERVQYHNQHLDASSGGGIMNHRVMQDWRMSTDVTRKGAPKQEPRMVIRTYAEIAYKIRDRRTPMVCDSCQIQQGEQEWHIDPDPEPQELPAPITDVSRGYHLSPAEEAEKARGFMMFMAPVQPTTNTHHISIDEYLNEGEGNDAVALSKLSE